MTIAIDCRSLRKKPAGVPNFLISFINALASKQQEIKILLLSNAEFSNEVKARLNSSPKIVILINPLPVLSSIAIIWYLIKIPILLRQLRVDYFYTPIPNLPYFLPKKTKTLITVHDMVYKLYPSTMSWGNWLINFFLHDYSVRNADRIWAVSQYTRKEVERFFPHRKVNEIFVGSSIDKSVFFTDHISEEKKNLILNKFSLNKNFMLFVGTLEPRKNIGFLLTLVPKLSQNGFDLVIVGAKGWGQIKFPELKTLTESQENKIKFLGFISIEELVLLYQLASAYVSTSINEGFGLPQLEAMSCGCPVVSPHNSAMIEIVEGAGETVKGWDKEKWISSILKVIEKRDFYSQRGLKRAQSHNWGTITNNLLIYLN